MFSCEIWGIFKNAYFEEHLRTTASEILMVIFQTYQRSLSSKKGIHKNLTTASKSFELYQDNPRMIPRHLNPKCFKMAISVEEKAQG